MSAETDLELLERLDTNYEKGLYHLSRVQIHREWPRLRELARKGVEAEETDRLHALLMCDADLSLKLATAQARIAELDPDKERFEFILSVLNEWDAFDEFVNAYHPTRRTTQRRAEDSEWRKTIDAARQKGKTKSVSNA